jgi:hypothetical protein
MKMTSERIALDKIYKRRDRYEIPDWQREEVWNKAKKQKLIDSILRGWKLPKFYFLLTGDGPKEYDVLDGQQRLTAVWEFFEGVLELPEQSASEFGGSTYEELPDDVSDAFDDYEINYDVIENAAEEDQKEFFQRLQEGLPLSSSEKLNSLHSKLRDYCAKLAKHKFFSETAVVSAKRYAYFDICAKVMALEIEGLDCGTRYEDIKSVFKQQSGFSGNSASAKRVRKALDILHKELPRPDNQLRNRTLLQALITFCCHLQNVGLEASQHKVLANFIRHFLSELSKQVELGQSATDYDYVAFQRTVNANVKSGPKTRNDILLRKLLQFEPSFFASVPQSNSLAVSLNSEINRLAESIRNLISDTNDVYSGHHGKDLFKPTNKSINSLTSGLSKPAQDYEGYKELVENLYFIFRESIGTRLEGKLPESFVDVNDLRTLNEHDVDHGKVGKVAKKKKELATAFEKYSGEKAPSAVDPTKFIIVQANILAALENDMRQLLKSDFKA